MVSGTGAEEPQITGTKHLNDGINRDHTEGHRRLLGEDDERLTGARWF